MKTSTLRQCDDCGSLRLIKRLHECDNCAQFFCPACAPEHATSICHETPYSLVRADLTGA